VRTWPWFVVLAAAAACSSYGSSDAPKTTPPEDAGHPSPDASIVVADSGADAGDIVIEPSDASTCDASLASDCKANTLVCLNACAVKDKQCHSECANSTPCNNVCDTVDEDCVKTCINGCLKCDSKNCAAPTACKALAN
jgi:hypothetical protein